ncbi:MAG TPA: RNA-binding protein [Polyangiaceae bacterium]|nr:RNA-binding protein [Polyangiaceae bacterium]
MSTRLFVGNLDYSTMDHQLQAEFSRFGEVVSASVVVDRMTGQSRGFGFVEFATPAEAQSAIDGMNSQMLNGRPLVVNVARERSPSPRGGGGGGRGFGGDRRDGGPRGGGRRGGGGGRW